MPLKTNTKKQSLGLLFVFLMTSAFLPIVSVRSVFAEVVLVHEVFWCFFDIGFDLLGEARHFGNFFQDNAVVNRSFWRLAPSKGTMVAHSDTWHCHWVNLTFAEGFNNHGACFFFVGRVDFAFCQ